MQEVKLDRGIKKVSLRSLTIKGSIAYITQALNFPTFSDSKTTF